jgi:hypothetical protein
MAERDGRLEAVEDRASNAPAVGELESVFRRANETIEGALLRLEANVVSVPFVCECGRTDCLQTIRLTVSEYESVRSDGRYFVCRPEHEATARGMCRVVRATARYVVIEMTGAAGEVALGNDPRRNDQQRTG